jgi:hypothetical protein
VRLCVVALDVSEFGGALEGIIVPVQVAHPSGKKRVRIISFVLGTSSNILVQVGVATANVANVAFEVLNVDGVEADDGREEAHVELGQFVTEVERTTGFLKILLCTVERLEQSLDVLLVSFLCANQKLASSQDSRKVRIRCKA